MQGPLDLDGVTVGILRPVCPGMAVAMEEPKWRPSSTGPHEQTWSSFVWEKELKL